MFETVDWKQSWLGRWCLCRVFRVLGKCLSGRLSFKQHFLVGRLFKPIWCSITTECGIVLCWLWVSIDLKAWSGIFWNSRWLIRRAFELILILLINPRNFTSYFMSWTSHNLSITTSSSIAPTPSKQSLGNVFHCSKHFDQFRPHTNSSVRFGS